MDWKKCWREVYETGLLKVRVSPHLLRHSDKPRIISLVRWKPCRLCLGTIYRVHGFGSKPGLTILICKTDNPKTDLEQLLWWLEVRYRKHLTYFGLVQLVVASRILTCHGFYLIRQNERITINFHPSRFLHTSSKFTLIKPSKSGWLTPMDCCSYLIDRGVTHLEPSIQPRCLNTCHTKDLHLQIQTRLAEQRCVFGRGYTRATLPK